MTLAQVDYIKTLSPACVPSLKSIQQLEAASLPLRSGVKICSTVWECNHRDTTQANCQLHLQVSHKTTGLNSPAFPVIQPHQLPAATSVCFLPFLLCDSRIDCAGAQPCRLALLVRYLSRTMMLLKRFDAPEAAGNDPAVLKAASRLDTRARDCAPLPCASRERFSEDLVQYLREAVGSLSWVCVFPAMSTDVGQQCHLLA